MDKAKKSLFNHIGLKILSLIVAVFMWVVIMNADDYLVTKTIRDIPVAQNNADAITNLSKVYRVESGETVDIVVKGPRSVVDPLNTSDFTASADLSEISITNSVQINVKANDSQLASKIQINPVDTTMNLSIEDVIEKEMPVKASMKGNVASGYALGNGKVTPNIIKIKGPESVINKVTEVCAEVNVAGMYTGFQKTVQPSCTDAYGENLVDQGIEFSVKQVSVVQDIFPTKTVPLKLSTTGTPASGFSVTTINYNPQEVTIAAEEETLNKVNAIYVDKLDVSGLDETREFNLKISDYLPEGVVLADTNDQLAVNIGFEKQVEKEIVLSGTDVEILGTDDQYEYSLVATPVFKARLTGLLADVHGVTKESLQLKIDATGLTPGDYEPKITYAVPKNSSVIIVGKVSLTVKEKAVPEPGEPGGDTPGEPGGTPGDTGGDGTGNDGTAPGTDTDGE